MNVENPMCWIHHVLYHYHSSMIYLSVNVKSFNTINVYWLYSQTPLHSTLHMYCKVHVNAKQTHINWHLMTMRWNLERSVWKTVVRCHRNGNNHRTAL